MAARRAASRSTPSRSSSSSILARTVERVGIDASCDGAEVEAGAADKDRDAAADGQVAKHSGGMRDEVRDAERRVRFDEVEAMVRNEGAFGDGRLGRPDVESKKDLPGIGRDDLDGSVWRREGLRELDGERRLAGRRCTGDHDEWRRAGHDRAMRRAAVTTRGTRRAAGTG
jgi:hypothetical protein